jgi:hypothetical protein
VLKAQAPSRSRPDGFEPNTLSKTAKGHRSKAIILRIGTNVTVIRFIVAGHFPQMNSEFSGHSGDGLVFFTGVMNEAIEGFSGVLVGADPSPGGLDKRTAKLWSAGFEDGAVSGRLA